MAIKLPVSPNPLQLPGGWSINAHQRQAIIHHNVVDPGCELLGYHRGRPVIWTYIVRPNGRGSESAPPDLLKRHVVVLQRNGLPGDLSENWEDGWVHLGVPGSHDGLISRRKRVTAIIEDWLSWSIRS